MIELDLRVSFEFPLLLTRNLQIWTWPNIFFLAALSAGVKHVEGGGLIEHPSDFEMPDFIVGEEVGLQHVGIFKKTCLGPISEGVCQCLRVCFYPCWRSTTVRNN